MTERSPFDIFAETYDTDFTGSAIGILQRKRVWNFLMPVLQLYQRPLRILEINCGTGEDALRLAEMGHSVIATDVSGAMIGKAKQKTDVLKIKTNAPEFIQCSFDGLLHHFSNKKFDLIFSDFGGINCIDKKELAQLSKDLSALMANDSQLFLVVMGRFCLWEAAYYTAKGKFKTAFRRLKGDSNFEANSHSMRVFYYSPRQLKTLFHPYFDYQNIYPVGLFIPPSYLNKQFSKRQHLLDKLDRLETKWGGHSVFSSLSDHFCIRFTRNSHI